MITLMFFSHPTIQAFALITRFKVPKGGRVVNPPQSDCYDDYIAVIMSRAMNRPMMHLQLSTSNKSVPLVHLTGVDCGELS